MKRNPALFLKQRCLAGVICLTLLVLSGTSSFACSCMRIGPPCEAAWLQADVVFIARAYSSVLLPTKRFGIDTVHRLVKVKISETFIGSDSGWLTVETGAGGSDCGYDFSFGREYLIYAHRDKDGSLSTSICMRTQKLADAANDLAYLRTIKNLAPTGRVYGTVKQYTFDPNFKPAEVSITSPYGGPEDQLMSMRALTGTAVHLKDSSGVKTRAVRAGQLGEFSFDGLAPGQYRISVDLQRTMKPWKPREITVPAKGCAQVSVRTSFNGRLAGRVSDQSGAAFPLVAIEVVRASEASQAERDFQWVITDKNGSFELGPLPPDEYVIGVNIVKYSGNHEQPKTYYPGTPNLQEAKKIRVGEGQLIQGLDFRLPVKASSRP